MIHVKGNKNNVQDLVLLNFTWLPFGRSFSSSEAKFSLKCQSLKALQQQEMERKGGIEICKKI